ncbi:MAG TPA: Hsp20/alpha crystallin family protein [Planktothrix sp.]|jgi:HSP20 family molecular chaperone IbpA
MQVNQKVKCGLVLALTLAVGFGSGFLTDRWSGMDSAHASEAAAVPVEKVQEGQSSKTNHLIAPHLWDVYVDPFFMPVAWLSKPLPLVPLINFPPTTPKIETIDGDKDLRVIAQVPGMDEKDVKVEASEHAVTIKAHKQQQEKHSSEFQSFDESFEQSVHLPYKVNPDKVQATVKDGILTVTLPKS